MINQKQRARLQRAINRLVRANEADSWKRGGDPADVPEIESELQRAKNSLKRTLDDLTVYEYSPN